MRTGADWALLARALSESGQQPYLHPVLVVLYSGAYLLRAVAWKALMVSRGSIFKQFVGLRAALLAIAANIRYLVSLSTGDGRWLRGPAIRATVIIGICGLLLALRWSASGGHDWLPEVLRSRFDILQSQLRRVSGRRLATAAIWTLPPIDSLNPPNVDLSNLTGLVGTLHLLRDVGVVP